MTSLLVLSALALAQAAASHGDHEHPEQLGQIAFETTCSPAAQATFAKGVAWLHSFEYEPAEKTFNEAAAADPSCAIAHWGTAMSLDHPLWAPPTTAELERGRGAVAKALASPAAPLTRRRGSCRGAKP